MIKYCIGKGAGLGKCEVHTSKSSKLYSIVTDAVSDSSNIKIFQRFKNGEVKVQVKF